jgi:hypothetical protein
LAGKLNQQVDAGTDPRETGGEKQCRFSWSSVTLGGFAMEDLARAQNAAIRKAEEMRQGGSDIRYIRTTFTPDDGRCMCLFEAQSDQEVKRLNDEAGLPYSRIVPARDLTPSTTA